MPLSSFCGCAHAMSAPCYKEINKNFKIGHKFMFDYFSHKVNLWVRG